MSMVYRYNQRMSEKCFDQCIHFDWSDDDWYEAEKAAKQLENQHRYDPTQRDIHPDKDLAGCITELTVSRWLEFSGIPHDTTPLFDPRANKDIGWDIQHARSRDDVKGRWHDPRYKYVGTGTPFWVNIDQHRSKEGKIDYYVFVLADRDMQTIHIAGCIGYHDLERVAREDRDREWPMYKIMGYQLKGYRNHIYGT